MTRNIFQYFLPIESAAFIDHCYLGETVKTYKGRKCFSTRSKDHKCFVKIPIQSSIMKNFLMIKPKHSKPVFVTDGVIVSKRSSYL